MHLPLHTTTLLAGPVFRSCSAFRIDLDDLGGEIVLLNWAEPLQRWGPPPPNSVPRA